MPEYTWYGRLAVWIGVVIMLLQAVTGRGSNVMTLVAVVGLTGGFLVFLGGLITDRGQPTRAPERATAAPDATQAMSAEPNAEVVAAAPVARVRGANSGARGTSRLHAETQNPAGVSTSSDESPSVGPVTS